MNLLVGLTPPDHVRRRAVDVRDAVPRPAGELDVLGPEALVVPLIRLGNLTAPNAASLCEHLGRRVAELGRTPRLRLKGAWALEGDDPAVGLRLDGDVDEIAGIARALPPMVAELDYFVDRRSFQPYLPLGTITASTTLPYLEHLVAALDEFESTAWDVHEIAVMARTWRSDGGTGFRCMAPLATTR